MEPFDKAVRFERNETNGIDFYGSDDGDRNTT